MQEPTTSLGIIDNVNYKNNIPFRIYNSLTYTYCTPKPNIIEMIETITLPYPPRFVNAFLYVNYVYLDTDERLKFARSNHEYLMEQLQYNQEIGIKSPNVAQNLALNHPCKAHYWIAQLDSLVGTGTINDVFNFTTSHIRYPDGRLYGIDLVKNAILLLNGRERFTVTVGEYFNLIVPYVYHYRGPVTGIMFIHFA